MNTNEIAKVLSNIDELDTWAEHIPKMDNSIKKDVYNLAQALWVERMIKTNKLLVNPEISNQLEDQQWQATDLQKRMIWASVLASAEGKESKQRFKTIKNMLLKKHGRDWWEDVYKRQKSAWAAKERIRKQTNRNNDSTAITAMVNNTILFSGFAAEERNTALKIIPAI